MPRSAHFLNLVGTFAAELTNVGNNFFLTTQNIYNFFSVSTSRWDILSKELNKISNATLPKNLCPTRWSSRYAVCKSIKVGYAGILSALKFLSTDINKKKCNKT